VEPREIYRASQLLSYLTGVFPQPNKAIVGRNAFAHEAGIHQHGMLQNGLTYEIIRPEMVGIPRSTLVLGKHSGRHGLERRFQDLGYDLTEEQLNEVYREFIALADRKREILDEDLLALLHDSFHDAPEEYQLTHLRVVCGSVSPSAEVRMTGPWSGERAARGTGDGPIAAAFTAISEITDRELEVLSLQLRSLTPGRDSVGQVFLQVKVNGKSLSGHGASTDIVEASARALVNAMNKARHADRLEASSLNSVYLWGV
jgi:2-isopropylmalate synthase